MEELDLESIRRTYPYMDKKCALCLWAHPTADLDKEGEWCNYFEKEVGSQQPACDFFVNRFVRYLL